MVALLIANCLSIVELFYGTKVLVSATNVTNPLYINKNNSDKMTKYGMKT